MYVTIFPALSWKISDSTYCLDLDHGKWLIPSDSQAYKGQYLYECNYKDIYYRDIYFDRFAGFMKSVFGGFVKRRILFPCPLNGTIKHLSRMYSYGDRDVSIPLRLRSKDDISDLKPMFYIVGSSNETLSPMVLHRNWFNFIDRHHDWMDSAMRHSSYYNKEWKNLVDIEKRYLEQQICPVLELDEFNRIWHGN